MSASLNMAVTQTVPSAKGHTLSAQRLKDIEGNAASYVSFIMSTFAEVMMTTRDKEQDSAGAMMESAFMTDMMGEAMSDSPLGREMAKDLMSTMIELASQENRP